MIHDRTYFNTADDGAVTVQLGLDGVTVTAFRPRVNRAQPAQQSKVARPTPQLALQTGN